MESSSAGRVFSDEEQRQAALEKAAALKSTR